MAQQRRWWRIEPVQIGTSLGMHIPTRYSEPHTPPPNALRSIDDTPPPKSSITINDAHRILLPRWALFFAHLNRFISLRSAPSSKNGDGRQDILAGLRGARRREPEPAIDLLQNSKAGEKVAESRQPLANARKCRAFARNRLKWQSSFGRGMHTKQPPS